MLRTAECDQHLTPSFFRNKGQLPPHLLLWGQVSYPFGIHSRAHGIDRITHVTWNTGRASLSSKRPTNIVDGFPWNCAASSYVQYLQGELDYSVALLPHFSAKRNLHHSDLLTEEESSQFLVYFSKLAPNTPNMDKLHILTLLKRSWTQHFV